MHVVQARDLLLKSFWRAHHALYTQCRQSFLPLGRRYQFSEFEAVNSSPKEGPRTFDSELSPHALPLPSRFAACRELVSWGQQRFAQNTSTAGARCAIRLGDVKRPWWRKLKITMLSPLLSSRKVRFRGTRSWDYFSFSRCHNALLSWPTASHCEPPYVRLCPQDFYIREGLLQRIERRAKRLVLPVLKLGIPMFYSAKIWKHSARREIIQHHWKCLLISLI